MCTTGVLPIPILGAQKVHQAKTRTTSPLNSLPFEMQVWPGVQSENPGAAYQKLPMQRETFAQPEFAFGHCCCGGRRSNFQIPHVHTPMCTEDRRNQCRGSIGFSCFPPLVPSISNRRVSTSPVSFHAAVVGFAVGEVQR